MSDKERLLDLKVGDEVCVSGGWGRMEILKVERLTNKLIFVNGEKYRRTNGYKISSDKWSCTSLEKVTDEVLQEIRIKKLKRQCSNLLNNATIPEEVVELEFFIATLNRYQKKIN